MTYYRGRNTAPGDAVTTHRLVRFCTCIAVKCTGECCQPNICHCHPEYVERMKTKGSRAQT